MIEPMTRPAPLPSTTAVLALVLFAAAGLSACADRPAADEIPPVVLTERDGVLRGPEEGARPVEPPSPAPAGNTRPEPDARREQDPPATTGDDQPDSPPPPPDDTAVTDDGETEAPQVEPAPVEEDPAGDGDVDSEDSADDEEDDDDGGEDGDD